MADIPVESDVYFERQTRLLCGVHALNNLVRLSLLGNALIPS